MKIEVQKMFALFAPDRELMLWKKNIQMLCDATLKERLETLLSAVVCGDEKLAKDIVTEHPELLLGASAIVKDLSGKEIKGLTPLQAAICAGDVEMVQMIFDVLQHKLPVGITLSFDPKTELISQFNEIYPEGIDALEAAQKAQAAVFKASTLSQIFTAINSAPDNQIQYELNTPGQAIIATEEEVRFELENPGIISERRRLNVALHYFRAQVAALSNQERIFNPFNLLVALELYDEQFNNFSGNQKSNKRALLWRQVVGYVQRYLPACYLQAFTQGVYEIVEKGANLQRTFEFRYLRGNYMMPKNDDLNNLGYKWAAEVLYGLRLTFEDVHHRHCRDRERYCLNFIENKKIRLGELTQLKPQFQWLQLHRCLPTRYGIM